MIQLFLTGKLRCFSEPGRGDLLHKRMAFRQKCPTFFSVFCEKNYWDGQRITTISMGFWYYGAPNVQECFSEVYMGNPVIVRQVGWGGIATELEESLLN